MKRGQNCSSNIRMHRHCFCLTHAHPWFVQQDLLPFGAEDLALRYPRTCSSLPQLLSRPKQIEKLPNTPRYSLLVLLVEAVPISQAELHFLLPLTLHASDDKVNSVGTDDITTYGQLC